MAIFCGNFALGHVLPAVKKRVNPAANAQANGLHRRSRDHSVRRSLPKATPLVSRKILRLNHDALRRTSATGCARSREPETGVAPWENQSQIP